MALTKLGNPPVPSLADDWLPQGRTVTTEGDTCWMPLQ
jgi:hypothetical protein